MARYRVHYSCRLTYDVDVEAESENEAIEEARPEWEDADFNDMDFADDDIDVWELS